MKGKIIVNDVQQMQTEGLNQDLYLLEEKRAMSTLEISIYVDFADSEIRGDVIAYGNWEDLSTEECIEYLQAVPVEKRVRDFESLLA